MVRRLLLLGFIGISTGTLVIHSRTDPSTPLDTPGGTFRQALSGDHAFPMDVECLFDWVVAQAPEYLLPAETRTIHIDGWAIRAFTGSEAYLAAYAGNDDEYTNKLFYLGPLSGNELFHLGMLDEWRKASQCSK